MTTPSAADLAKLYIAFFNRAPDAAGLQYWLASDLPLDSIAESFNIQKETQDLYGDLDDIAFVTAIYRHVFNRDPDTQGLDYWVADLATSSRANLVMAILAGAQDDDVLLLANKIDVGLYYAQHGDDSPNAWQVLSQCGLSPESVQLCKQWIDGKIPASNNPSNYVELNNAKQHYELTGTSGDDVFVVKKFLTANINGGSGEDTIDFSNLKTGVSINLSTGLASEGINLENIEHIRGTAQTDILIGNASNNILVAGGGFKDYLDGSVGDDRLLFENWQDVVKAETINGGQGTDTLVITQSTIINLTASNAPISDIEILQVGYSKEDKTAATTIKVGDTGTSLDTFELIRGTNSVDNKGRPTSDIIVYAGAGSLLDVSQVMLESIEGLENRVEGGRIRINAQTVDSVNYMIGAKGRSTTLELAANSDDTFDLNKISLTDFDRIQQLAATPSTIIVNQTLVDSLAGAASSKVAFTAGGFGQSTLQLATDLNLNKLNDGDYNFRYFNYAQATSLIIGQVVNKLTQTKQITGSNADNDYLGIIHLIPSAEDLTGITVKHIERLDVEGVSVLQLDNDNLLDVQYLTGNETASLRTLLDASKEKAEGGLDLSGINVGSFAGFTGEGTITLDTKTTWDSAFIDLGLDKANILLLGEAGSYDFGQIEKAQLGQVTIETLPATNQIDANILTTESYTLNEGDKVVGSSGNDTVSGGKIGFGYDLALGDDQFNGSNTANEWVLGGEGNDSLNLGDNTQGITLVTLNAAIKINTGFTGNGAFADGGDGDDRIISGKGDDVLIGGLRHDLLSAGEGNDILSGGDGDDILSGGEGNDWLSGGSGNDVIQGDAGDDVIYAGQGQDSLRGGTLGLALSADGQDQYHFAPGDSGLSENTVDCIVDFYSYQHALKELSAADALKAHDIIYVDWQADNFSEFFYAGGASLEALDINTNQGVVADSGQAYGVLLAYIETMPDQISSLLDATTYALTNAYKQQHVMDLLADAGVAGDGKADYTSLAVQFTYQSHTYVAVDTYVTNNTFTNCDLLLQIDNLTPDWALTADGNGMADLIVTRWDVTTP